MDVQCPKCGEQFPVKSESHSKAGKARAKLWTKEQRVKAGKRSWKTRKKKAKDSASTTEDP